MPSPLEQSIFNTVRYFALFDMPVTAVQIWRVLVLDQEDSRLRWRGQHLPSLAEVRELSADSAWLLQRLGSTWGYFFLRGREESVKRRLQRHVLAQHKWRLTQRLVRWLAAVPGVCMLAGSGSLALSNTRPASDLDLFVIVRAGRIWTTRLLLLFVAQLLGRRRKYWNEKAPDMLCLNHYITDRSLVMPPAVRNLYTAGLYAHLVPVFGQEFLAPFQAANAAWMKNYLMYPDHISLSPQQAVSLPYSLLVLKRIVESIILEPLGHVLERGAEKVQRYIIARHIQPDHSGRMALSSTELAFHAGSVAPDLLRRFAQDTGQKTLL